eukprot:COSAG02_NODE_3876_length_6103_cov_2.989007_3_plen_44_part_00
MAAGDGAVDAADGGMMARRRRGCYYSRIVCAPQQLASTRATID